jgi:nitrate/TMAO reductase-like tetraheme cytochrome c subunit
MNKIEREEYNRIYKEENKKRLILRKKQYYQENKPRLLANQLEYSKKHREDIRKYQRTHYRFNRYGIDKDMFAQMLAYQDNKCDICKTPFDMSSKKLSPHVDHNHSTGQIRHLLCMNCNCGIGSFNEDMGVLQNAIKYLENFK